MREGAPAGLLFDRTYSIQGIILDFLAVVQNDSTKRRGIALSVVPRTKAERADMLSTKMRASPSFFSVGNCQKAIVAASNSNVKMSSGSSHFGGLCRDSCHGGEQFLMATMVPMPDCNSFEASEYTT